MNKNKYINLLFVFTLAFASCQKIQTLPDTPYIEFRSFSVFDTTDILGNYCQGGRLNFYFEDGDGDLGLKTLDDEETADTTNLFLTLYRKMDGVMIPVPDDDPMKPSSYRIPYMERTGQNKILKGTISVTFLYLFYDIKENDTILYDFYIKDRMENFSNTASTSEIPLSYNGIYKIDTN